MGGPVAEERFVCGEVVVDDVQAATCMAVSKVVVVVIESVGVVADGTSVHRLRD